MTICQTSIQEPTVKIRITGIVQGVGFRPHVYRCAEIHKVKGYVLNDNEGVIIYAQAERNVVLDFLETIQKQAPVLSCIEHISYHFIQDKKKYTAFTIETSKITESKTPVTPPDSFVCAECLEELFNPRDRRYLYPFINCVHCGPRYSIITGAPYDRHNTTMSAFELCDECKKEYENSSNRRFHAEPIACPICGPTLKLYSNQNEIIPTEDMISTIITLLKNGNILAVKGIGGYHLMVDPYNSAALARLRSRKKRDEKPFCLIFESLEECQFYCDLSSHEIDLLTSIERPIVLTKKSNSQDLPDLVAPKNKYFGVMLAYTPLQHILLRNNFPCLICTSANISDEPIIFQDDIKKLGSVADYVVTHDRVIHTFVDDSVVRSIQGETSEEIQIIRRARGYTPKSIKCTKNSRLILSIGAELKNTVCIVKNETLLMSQYIGDLKNLSTYESFQNVISHMRNLFNFEPQLIACDLHPNFLNTNYANKLDIPLIRVQHHYAHLCACMIENNFQGDAIGVIFDGMGFGLDGNIWGGEFIVGNYKEFQRIAHFEYFPLPGGDICRKKISIAAFACLLKIFGSIDNIIRNWTNRLTMEEMQLYQKMISSGINSPLTSSVGRIFDVVSSLLGLCDTVAYEGQAAILLEQVFDAKNCDIDDYYPFNIQYIEGKHLISLDKTFLSILNDKNSDIPIDKISLKFHNTIIKIIYEVCLLISEIKQIKTVVLSGGCFQNKFLLESAIKVLSNNGFRVLYHKQFPTNDGGIALGQAAHAIYSSNSIVL